MNKHIPLTTRYNCPACEKNRFKVIFSMAYKKKEMITFLKNHFNNLTLINKLRNCQYNLMECKECNLIFQEQIPSKKFSYELYENFVDQEYSFKKKENFEKKYKRKLLYETSLIKNIFKKKNEEISILDFGAGWGFWLTFLKKNRFNVFGYEISQTRLNFLKKKEIKIVSDIKNTSYKFDFIYSEETFEHIPNPKEVLMDLSKILKKDGFIMLRFPNSFLFKFKLNDNYLPTADCARPLEHINLLKKKSFQAMIEGTNLEIINFKSKFNFSIKNFLKDLKNFFYFDSIMFKKIK